MKSVRSFGIATTRQSALLRPADYGIP